MKKLIKKYTATTIVMVSVAITIIMIFAKPAPKPVQVKFVPPMVETLDAIPQTYKVIINSQGTVAPQKEITLTSEISGKIDYVSPKIQNGSSFEAGDTLIILDQRDFELALIAAQSSMYQAQVIFERELAESEIAKKEWSSIREGNASNLALRKPQLDQAKAALAPIADLLAFSDHPLFNISLFAPSKLSFIQLNKELVESGVIFLYNKLEYRGPAGGLTISSPGVNASSHPSPL